MSTSSNSKSKMSLVRLSIVAVTILVSATLPACEGVSARSAPPRARGKASKAANGGSSTLYGKSAGKASKTKSGKSTNGKAGKASGSKVSRDGGTDVVSSVNRIYTPFPTSTSKPSSKPSASKMPSSQPSLTSEPSSSLQPSSQPSTSGAPSFQPTHLPSTTPSTSSNPSSKPSFTSGPTSSMNPSSQPSASSVTTATVTNETSVDPPAVDQSEFDLEDIEANGIITEKVMKLDVSNGSSGSLRSLDIMVLLGGGILAFLSSQR